MKNKLHVHIKTDIIFVGLLILGIHIYFLLIFVPMQTIFECSGLVNCYIEYLNYFWVRDILNTFNDLWNLAIWLSFIFGYIVLFNYGFRVFEWDEERFCMKSWFGKRCYKWRDVREVYISTKVGSKLIDIVTWNNFYYCPYNGRLHGVLEEISEQNKYFDIEIISDPGENISELRKIRKEHGTHMMLFQP